MAPGVPSEVRTVEGIIIAAILWFFFRAITRKAREAQGTAAGGRAGQNAGQAVTRPTPQRQHAASPQRDTAPAKVRSNLTASPGSSGSEGEAQYSVIRPTVLTNNVMNAYSGSLGGDTREGMRQVASVAPQEGAATAEGEDTCDPTLDHARTQSMQAYAIQSGENETQTVLPLHWTGDELVRGFVFRELLEKPRKWGEHHG